MFRSGRLSRRLVVTPVDEAVAISVTSPSRGSAPETMLTARDVIIPRNSERDL
jgi:hypothetical protein